MRVPKLDYLPRGPRYPQRHKLGLIGCGGISRYHLEAARSFGLEVVALADVNPAAAESRRAEYFPQAAVYLDHRALLARDDITAVEIATHTAVRTPQIFDALRAGKHVLSQKPFTFDLAEGRRMVALANRQGLRLGVNQNGRWAPQFSALLAAVRGGLLGDIHTLDMVMEWDHTWTRGSKFEELHHLILSDFAIHWFDIAATVFDGRTGRSVFANAVQAPQQDMKPPMLANAVINFGNGLATLGFSAFQSFAPHEYLCCVGSKGTLRGAGNLCNLTELEFTNKSGTAKIPLEGQWFPDGFRGTLGEFLRSIEEDREPTISGRNNLRSLELCFAALASADTGLPVKPGQARQGRL
jgi:predicted dehydrogenase